MKLKGRRKSTNVEDRRGSSIPINDDGLTSELVKTSYDNRKRRSDEYAASQPKPKVNPAKTPKPRPKPTEPYVKLSGTLPWRRGG